MDGKNMFYLLLSRYITYIGTFIISILMVGKDFNKILFFSLLFVLVIINSTIRLYKLEKKQYAFMISILLEILTVLFMQYKFNAIAFVVLYILVVDLYLMLNLRQALFMSILLYGALLLFAMNFGKPGNIGDALSSFMICAFIMIFFSGAAYATRKELNTRMEMEALYNENKRAREELESANLKLREYAKKVEDITLLNERNRLAGEIHDTIGHSLTALIMEIDICRKLVDRDVEKTREELEKASDLARDALYEVRKSVKAIKPENMEEMMGIRAVEELIREFEKTTRIIIKFNASKNRYKLSPSIDVTIYRTIQEALTNCAKHGQADRVGIDLLFRENHIELSIKDNGKGCREFEKGVGIKTMEERIHSLGGSVEFEYNNGFEIGVVIPVEVVQ